jgi:hypothetical protein
LQRCLNILGLILNMVGVAILFRWAPPQPTFEGIGGIVVENANVLPSGKTAGEERADAAARQVHYKRMSRVGLVFIFAGFACQLGGEILA